MISPTVQDAVRHAVEETGELAERQVAIGSISFSSHLPDADVANLRRTSQGKARAHTARAILEHPGSAPMWSSCPV